MEKKRYVALRDYIGDLRRMLLAGKTRLLTDEEARPLLERGIIAEYTPPRPKRFVELTNPDGSVETLSWGQYLSHRHAIRKRAIGAKR